MSDRTSSELASPIRPAIPSFLTAAHLIFLLTVRRQLAKKKLIFLVILVALPSFVAIVMKTQGVGLAEGWHVFAPQAFLWFLTPIIALFFGGSVFGEDVDNHTIGYLLMRPLSRDAIFCGKVAGVSAITFGFVFFSTLAAYFPSIYAGSIASLFQIEHLRDLCGLLAVIAVASLVYSLFFIALGLRVRHVMISGILYFIIVEVGFTSLPGPPAMISMAHHLGRLLPQRFSTIEVLQEEEIFHRAALQNVDAFGEMAGIAVLIVVLAMIGLASARSNDFYETDDD